MSTPDTPPTAEAPAASAAAAPALSPVSVPQRRVPWALAALGLACAGSLALGWSLHARLQTLEPELVRRQQASQDQAAEARLLARQAHDAAGETAAKLALLEARVAETALQRAQVEELIASLSRSRDENVLADVEAALRVAQQQAAITGSLEPVVAALKQSDERLARYNQPRLDRVRRAVARDLDRMRAVAVADVPSLSIRLDEVVRLVDDLPLLSTPSRGRNAAAAPAREASAPVQPASAASDAGLSAWWQEARSLWDQLAGLVWQETRSLVRVTEIAHPEGMLVSPEQGFFVRENLKLRLLNARLALLSRQFDQAQGDLALAQQALDRYFDPSSRRVSMAREQLRVVSTQSRQVNLPRPDDTLAALATAAAGR